MRLLPFLFLAAAAGFSPAAGPEPGERAVYVLRWSFVSVGTVTMGLEEAGPGELQATLVAKANAFMRTVHDFHTVISSRFPPGAGRSLGYERHEKATGNVHETFFDWEEGTVRYSKNGDTRVPLRLPDGAQDPFSIVYAFRSGAVPLAPGRITVPVTDGKAVARAVFRIGEPETVDTRAGEFRAVPVTADFKDVRAIFARPEGALVTVWLSDDARRLPVKLESEATIGSFRAVLERIE